MPDQELIDTGNRMMDNIDQAIERSKKVVQDTVNVGTETTAALKAHTKQMSRIVNELDSIHFSLEKASKLVKEIGRQVASGGGCLGVEVQVKEDLAVEVVLVEDSAMVAVGDHGTLPKRRSSSSSLYDSAMLGHNRDLISEQTALLYGFV